MSRTIQLSLPSGRTEAFVSELLDLDGIVALGLQRGASLKPPGDIVTIQATNEGLMNVCRILDRLEMGDAVSAVTSEPDSMIAAPHMHAVHSQTNEAIWEEMGALLRRETNPTTNYLSAMLLSGAVAAVGLWTDAVHLVVGAMVIAPGFQPLVRLPFSLIEGRPAGLRQGVASTTAGYAALVLGAGLCLVALQWVEGQPYPRLDERQWIQYWSTVSSTGVVVALAASAAGAAIIAAQRSVLTAGVMIALALVPGMAIAGMAMFSGEWLLAGKGALRWAVDAGCVLLGAGLVLSLKQMISHRRRSLG